MDIHALVQENDFTWRIPTSGDMHVPAVLYGDRGLIEAMDDKVREQLCHVAALPGIVDAAYAMPDAHWGYGFPIGGVAAFDPAEGGVVSMGGVGFDISCGVRALTTNVSRDDVLESQHALANALFTSIPAGVGSRGSIHLSPDEMDAMLMGGARWAVEAGYGVERDLERTEEQGCMAGADPVQVSERARQRQRDEMGTLGSGNHYLEVQQVAEIHDAAVAAAFGLAEGGVVISIHCGSRGLGHQIGTEYLREMAVRAGEYGLILPAKELACAPLDSSLGQEYLGALRAGINCALANRQILTALTRETMADVLPGARCELLYDVSHNTCKEEAHVIDGEPRRLFVHRKGATRAFGPGHPGVPEALRDVGQPVLVGGTMGTASFVLVGTTQAESLSFSSACHGAGRAMSRHQAKRRWRGRDVLDHLADQGIIVRSPSMRGVAEEAPDAYKDVGAVVDAAEAAGLARKVARLEPMICIKG